MIDQEKRVQITPWLLSVNLTKINGDALTHNAITKHLRLTVYSIFYKDSLWIPASEELVRFKSALV